MQIVFISAYLVLLNDWLINTLLIFLLTLAFLSCLLRHFIVVLGCDKFVILFFREQTIQFGIFLRNCNFAYPAYLMVRNQFHEMLPFSSADLLMRLGLEVSSSFTSKIWPDIGA